ncbi:MAG: glycosyltransferase family 1 protein [Candidatus Heimdallarchaeota archaeon]|nr:MAG: glycosyltransferase family 1 protein [Candidatus Heimdallarchaeota archaeon]
MKTKIAIITHGFKVTSQYCYLSVRAAFDKAFDVTWVVVDNGWPIKIKDIPNRKKQKAIIWFVGFKHLYRKTFDWGTFKGKRIMYDFDACQNYGCGIGTSVYKGKWPEVFRRYKFDLLVCTGKRTTNSLKEEGINTHWIPKAFDGDLFYDKEKKRRKDEVCYYGNLYQERREMLDYLEEKNICVKRINCSYFLLNDFLNMYKACIIYNGIEPMIKQFEIAASGCVPFCNEIFELSDLGFKDGKNMISYDSFENLIEKLKYYTADRLFKIGRAAAELAKERHTWLNRMEMFKEIII